MRSAPRRRLLAVAMTALEAGLVSAAPACTYDVPELAVVDASVRRDASVDARPGVEAGPGQGDGEAGTWDGPPLGPPDAEPDAAPGTPDAPLPEAGDAGPVDAPAPEAGPAEAGCPGGAIAFIDEATTTLAGGTSLPVTGLPSVLPGDTLLGFVAVEAIVGNPTTLTAPAGFTLVGQCAPQDTLGLDMLAVYVHTAGPGEPSSYGFTASTPVEGVAWLLHYAGVDPVQSIDVQSIGEAALSPLGTYESPPLTTTGQGEVVVVSFAAQSGGAGAATWSVPVGTTQRASIAGAGQCGSSDDELAASPGTIGPFQTMTSPIVGFSSGCAAVLALRPCP
jgi:hypothetical protein